MSLALLVLWGAVGCCGTPWPRKWPPPPQPDPWWFVDRLVGIVAGIIGGWLFIQAWPVPEAGELVALTAVSSVVGAFVASLIVLDVYYSFVPARRTQASASERVGTGMSGDQRASGHAGD